MRDPNARFTRQFGDAASPEGLAPMAPKGKQPVISLELLSAVNADGGPDLKEMENSGLLPKFLRLWNNAATLQRLKAVARLMKADGVAAKDKPAIKAWADKRPGMLNPDKGKRQTAPPKPVVNTGPAVGRNDPCPCGSSKKFKKCCAGK